MSILLSLLLAQARVLPEVDRRALDLQARAEALQTRRTAPRPAAVPAPRRIATQAATPQRRTQTAAAATQPVRRAAAPQRLPSPRRASGGALDLSAITTICRAAGNQADPATFIATLSRAYSLTTPESSSLRTSCAAYLAGRADARVNNYGAPAH
ncbi:MAG TPA: hypothetical protein VGB54_03985 [Allosphingosinicella sp.]|jgi:hypothetical protein